MHTYRKKGYLNSEFKLFHLVGAPEEEIGFHYHDFHKIILFLKGNVHYMVEGKTYELAPYDIVFVNRNDIHKPVIDSSVLYERIIVYISPGFIDAYRTDTYDLSYCFHKAKEEQSNVLRILPLSKSVLLRTAKELEHSFTDTAYANTLYRQVLFLEFMIQLNRAALSNHLEYIDSAVCNQKVVDILRYINLHLTSDLTIEHIAQEFYLSRYHMMRIFKEETGYTIGKYITYKRLSMARELIAEGVPLTSVCFDCGFKDYSTFSRAYKKLYGKSPNSGRSTLEK